MDTIFANLVNRKTFKPHVLILKLTNKLDLRLSGKVIALSKSQNLLHMKKHKTSFNNNKFR